MSPHHISDVSPWLPGYLLSQSRLDNGSMQILGWKHKLETFIFSMNLPGIRNENNNIGT